MVELELRGKYIVPWTSPKTYVVKKVRTWLAGLLWVVPGWVRAVRSGNSPAGDWLWLPLLGVPSLRVHSR